MLRITIENVPAGAPHKRTPLATIEIIGAPERDAEGATIMTSDFYAVASGDAIDSRRQGVVRAPVRCRWGVFRMLLEAIKTLRLDLIER